MRVVEVLSPPLRALVDAVTLVGGQCPTELPEAQALAEAAVLLWEMEKLQAVSLRRIADVHTRQLHTHAGAPSTSSWVTGLQVGVPGSVVALAKRLDRVPAVADAVTTGRIAMPGAVKVAGALDKVRRHVDRPDGLIDGHDGEAVVTAVVVEGVLFQLAEARGGYADDDPQLHQLVVQLHEIAELGTSQLGRLEQALLVLAEHLEPHHLDQALERLVDAVLPLELERRADRGHDQRGLRLVRKSDGSGFTLSRADLDLETGELLFTVLTAARATDPDNPADTAAWATQRAEQHSGDGGTGSHSAGASATMAGVHDTDAPAPRSRVQQDHDALRLALRALLDSQALGSRAKAAPHLLITVNADTLHETPGALPAVGASGTTLPAGLVRRLAGDSQIMRLVLSLGRKVLEVSHTERTLKAHERRALHVQWGGRCATAGCTSPPGTHLAPHHAHAWHRTGTTSYSDTIPLCPTHHHDLHEGQRTLRLRDRRHLGPDGWTDGPSG